MAKIKFDRVEDFKDGEVAILQINKVEEKTSKKGQQMLEVQIVDAINPSKTLKHWFMLEGAGARGLNILCSALDLDVADGTLDTNDLLHRPFQGTIKVEESSYVSMNMETGVEEERTSTNTKLETFSIKPVPNDEGDELGF